LHHAVEKNVPPTGTVRDNIIDRRLDAINGMQELLVDGRVAMGFLTSRLNDVFKWIKPNTPASDKYNVLVDDLSMNGVRLLGPTRERLNKRILTITGPFQTMVDSGAREPQAYPTATDEVIELAAVISPQFQEEVTVTLAQAAMSFSAVQLTRADGGIL